MKDLHNIITPSLLRGMSHARAPWDPTQPISGRAMMTEFFSNDYHFSTAVKQARPALKALSRAYGPDTIPDMTSFLPAPDAADFPEQAFGLHVLIDQAPRVLFQGIDGRWTSYFDKVARKLYKWLYALPEDTRPWSRERWSDASFEYWLCVATEFNATMAHQESIACQEVSEGRTEELRLAVEEYTGHRDPGRDDEELRRDVYAMPRITSNADLGHDWTFDEAAFFFFKVDNAHKPIIDRYGRYPYRNAIEGRESTTEDMVWIENTNHWAEAKPDIARRVREDVKAGTWTPLGEGEEASSAGRDVPSGTKLKIEIRVDSAWPDEFERVSVWLRHGMSCAQ